MNLPTCGARLPVKNTYKQFLINIKLSTYTVIQKNSHSLPVNYKRRCLLKQYQGGNSYPSTNSSFISHGFVRWPNTTYCIYRQFKSSEPYLQTSVENDKPFEAGESACTENSNEAANEDSSPSVYTNLNTEEKTTDVKRKKKKKKDEFKFTWAAWNRPEVHLDLNTEEAISKGKLKCRTKKIKVIDPPEDITKTINRILKGDIGVDLYGNIGDEFPSYVDAGIKFRRYIDSRKPAVEDNVKKVNRGRIEVKVRRKLESEVKELFNSTYDEIQFETEVQKETERLMTLQLQTLENQSKPIHYDKNAAWAYLLGKAAFDYATMYKILSDIKERTQLEYKNVEEFVPIEGATLEKPCNSYKPRTLFDFGSGVGTSVWAVKEVFGEMSEAFCVDSSKDMTDLAMALLMKGHAPKGLPAGYTFRLHTPRDDKLTYDLVTCSHSLLHINTQLERINIVDNLWRKTSTNGGFLILVESGTNAGFQVLQEARHYLSQIAIDNKEKPNSDESKFINFSDSTESSLLEENCDIIDTNDKPWNEKLVGHLYSPCPHTKTCPRYEFDSIPCNFDIRHRNFPIDKINKALRDNVHESRFSYIVFRKGKKSTDCEWPRVVEPIKPCLTNNLCRLCTPRGTLEELFIKDYKKEHKNNKLLSKRIVGKYVKSLNCGDQFKGHLECGFENYKDFVSWATTKKY